MRHIIPHPAMAVCLWLMWLMLNQSVSPGHILLGVVVAIAGVHALSAIQPPDVTIRFTPAVLSLVITVIVDIIRSNLAVGRIIISLRHSQPTSGFVEIPLDMDNRYGLAVLAVIITATPGTLWVQYDSSRSVLLIHVLDLVDEGHWITLIKNRYEQQLMEIFT